MHASPSRCLAGPAEGLGLIKRMNERVHHGPRALSSPRPPGSSLKAPIAVTPSFTQLTGASVTFLPTPQRKTVNGLHGGGRLCGQCPGDSFTLLVGEALPPPLMAPSALSWLHPPRIATSTRPHPWKCPLVEGEFILCVWLHHPSKKSSSTLLYPV